MLRSMNAQTRRRAAALLEVPGVSLAGPLVIWALRRLIGVSVTNPLNNLSVHTTDAELITASRQMFVLLMFQYAGYFLLIFPINWWYRRRVWHPMASPGQVAPGWLCFWPGSEL